jgi:hypothetical protein
MSAVDWKEADRVADVLGLITRELVAERNEEATREWALKMASAHNIYDGNSRRGASYLELAVLLGHEVPTEEKEEPAEVEQAA